MHLNNQQSDALQEITNWLKDYNDERQFFVLSGYAGTGKTTIISYLIDYLNSEKTLPYKFISCATLTGKASTVLKDKLDQLNCKTDFVGTIHSLIYKPVNEYDPTTKTSIVKYWDKREFLSSDLIIIDEASMVNDEMFNDLLSYDVPILLVGDPFQLPPIGNQDSIIERSSSFKLTEIHRQAIDDPITYLANFVRENGYIPYGIYSSYTFKLNWKDDKTKELFHGIDFDKNIICLCGTNKLRTDLNLVIRNKMKNFPKHIPVYPQERLVCLINNNHTRLMNGQLATVLLPRPGENRNFKQLDLELDNGEIYTTMAYLGYLGKDKYNNIFQTKKFYNRTNKTSNRNIDFFDYGYCITVHKAQGSEFQKVVVFEEKFQKHDMHVRWLYTAITRSYEKLFVIGND